MLGTNGGGFFSANSSHPFENPTPFSNFMEMFSIFFHRRRPHRNLGRMTGSPGHGWAVFACMSILFAAGFTVAYWAESHLTQFFTASPSRPPPQQSGGNMEGKETRFGIADSRSSPLSPPMPAAAPSIPGTIPSPPWVA